MSNARWLAICRWANVLLVVGYVLVTIVVVIVWLMVSGVRMANWVRWAMLIGWLGVCFGGVVLVEAFGATVIRAVVFRGCRLPIRVEEERLEGLMREVWKGLGVVPERSIRFMIRSDPEGDNGSFGRRTILISSGTLMWASDGELRGILAHELGHLLDGDRVFDTAFATAGFLARGFRLSWRFSRWWFRMGATIGFLYLVLLSRVWFGFLLLYLLDATSRLLRRGLIRWREFRQDRHADRCGCGEGLHDWLVKSGLAANVDRIRRLEKLTESRE
jgi:hypothetical protein